MAPRLVVCQRILGQDSHSSRMSGRREEHAIIDSFFLDSQGSFPNITLTSIQYRP